MIEIKAYNVTPASRRCNFRVLGLALTWTILLAGCQQPSDDKVIEQLPEPFLIKYQISTQPAALPVEPIAQKIELPANPFAKWLPPGGLSKRWNCIVIHHTASDIGSLNDIDRWHREKGWDCCGYHFVIGNGAGSGDGQIEMGPRWRNQSTGAHTRQFGAPSAKEGNYYNEHGIGIVLVGNFDKAPPTQKQMKALADLVHLLRAECNMPDSRIYVHGDLKQTDCPGLCFPRMGLASRLKALRQRGEG